VPGPDAHKRPDNPLERADATGQSNVLFWCGLLPAIPAVTAVYLGQHFDIPVLAWAGGPIGLATGIALGWWLDNLAAEQLTARGAEMHHVMRTGRSTTAGGRSMDPTIEVSRRDSIAGVLYWVFGSILLFPQGIVPIIFILTGVAVKSWFLAMYLPIRWGLPVAGASILIGTILYFRAIMITSATRASRPSARPPPAPESPAPSHPTNSSRQVGGDLGAGAPDQLRAGSVPGQRYRENSGARRLRVQSPTSRALYATGSCTVCVRRLRQ
jgi:hypothetical protein